MKFKLKKGLAMFGGIMLAAALGLTACADRDDADTAGAAGNLPAHTPTPTEMRAQGGDLVVSLMSFPPSLTMTRNDSASAQFSRQIFEPLIHLHYDEVDSSLTPMPGLAESWEVIDAQTISMSLRPGVLFHNGAPLTSYDVQFSLERATTYAEPAVVASVIDHVEVINDLDFIIHLNIPFVPIISNLGHTILGIMHMESYLANPDHPIGTGPFMFEYLVIDNYIRMNRFADYWGTPAYVDSLTFMLIGDGSIRVIEADAGNVHISLDIQPAQRRAAESSGTATLMLRDNLSMNYVGFNLMREGTPFADPRVRRAVNYAIDVEGIIEAVFEGAGRPLQGVPLSDINRDFRPGVVAPMDFNIDRALELMAEAGFADGFEASIWYNIPNVARATMAEMIANNLRQIGINVTITGMEWETYLDMTSDFEHDMFLLGWVSVVGDLDYALHPLFHSENLGRAGNRFGLVSDRLDYLLDGARVEIDETRRLEMYMEALVLLDEYLPMALLNQGEFMVHVHQSVGGLVLNPAGHFNFATVFFYVAD